MMLGGGSCMIICKMGHLFITKWELAGATGVSTDTQLQVCMLNSL